MNGPSFLVFTLYANIGALGDGAAGRNRTGTTRPARAATMGLLGAALGIDAEDDTGLRALDTSLHLAVRTESAGVGFTDYHTTQTPMGSSARGARTRREVLASKRLHTVPSKREWRAGAMFTIVVWAREDETPDLHTLARALRRPAHALYMGRKASSIGLPPRAEVVRCASFIEAFDARAPSEPERWVARHCGADRNAPRHIVCDANAPGAPANARIESVRDVSESRAHWRFAEREIRTFTEGGQP